jgi:hypothetical protein
MELSLYIYPLFKNPLLTKVEQKFNKNPPFPLLEKVEQNTLIINSSLKKWSKFAKISFIYILQLDVLAPPFLKVDLFLSFLLLLIIN